MAMALGQNPETYFQTGAAPPPGEADLDAAVATVADLMAMVFDSLGITGFDIMSSAFAADGTGFDELKDRFDTLAAWVDPVADEGPSLGITTRVFIMPAGRRTGC